MKATMDRAEQPHAPPRGHRSLRYNSYVLRDTDSAAMARYHALLRAQAPYQRLAQAVALTRMTRQLALAGIRQRHPGVSEEEVHARLIVRLYGRRVAERLCGPVPADAI